MVSNPPWTFVGGGLRWKPPCWSANLTWERGPCDDPVVRVLEYLTAYIHTYIQCYTIGLKQLLMLVVSGDPRCQGVAAEVMCLAAANDSVSALLTPMYVCMYVCMYVLVACNSVDV